jgi:YCII-related domain-containing protein
MIITDEYMRDRIANARSYSIVILRMRSPKGRREDGPILWEHGRRNFELHAAGKLPIVCPATDDSNVAGVYIFDVDIEGVKRIMDGDPGVQAGIFEYEVHPCKGFLGSASP